MQKFYFLVVICGISQLLQAQSFYTVTFNSGSFPAGWVANDGRVMLVNNVPSSGYSSSPTSPEASGSYNVLFQHCAPISSTITLTVSGVISTVGLTNIRVGFGRRATAAWDREIALEWSSDGTSWNLVSNDVSSGASTTWGSIYYDLPAAASNVSNLRFRFSYTTATNQNCTAPPNFRIDDFTLGSGFSLPVELITFNAQLIRRQVHLNWSTASELDNKYFEVEHSLDGKTFAILGQITGAGTTQSAQQYAFVHSSPLPGTNYYRLRQVDQNGQVAYSILRSVLFGEASSYKIFPSPATEMLYVQWQQSTEQVLNWAIYNTVGKLIEVGQVDSADTALEIPIQRLPKGGYVLHLLQEQNSVAHKFIKL
jgi:hypothetical protein